MRGTGDTEQYNALPAVLGFVLALLFFFSVTAPAVVRAADTSADITSPEVTYAGPNGTVGYDSPFLFGKIDEVGSPRSGIASASVSINGAALIPCTVTPNTWTCFWAGGWGWECPQAGLSAGHYDVVVFATDKAGNTGQAVGSFDVGTSACVNGRPLLATRWDNPVYWASMPDYLQGILSVDVSVDNQSSLVDAYNLRVNEIVPFRQQWISPAQQLPLIIGDVPAGGHSVLPVKVQVLYSWTQFIDFYMLATAEDSCGNVYSYPR